MQRLEVSGAVRPIYGSLGVKRLTVLRATELYDGLLRLSGKFSILSCTGFRVRSSLVNPTHNRTE